MITDIRLLGELNEVKGSRLHEHLQGLLNASVTEARNASTDRDATIAIGKQRVLESILTDIDTALETFQALREKETTKKTVDMQKAY